MGWFSKKPEPKPSHEHEWTIISGSDVWATFNKGLYNERKTIKTQVISQCVICGRLQESEFEGHHAEQLNKLAVAKKKPLPKPEEPPQYL